MEHDILVSLEWATGLWLMRRQAINWTIDNEFAQ